MTLILKRFLFTESLNILEHLVFLPESFNSNHDSDKMDRKDISSQDPISSKYSTLIIIFITYSDILGP